MRQNVKISILGLNYAINLDMPDSKIREVEAKLNQELTQIKEIHPHLSTAEALVYTSFSAFLYIFEQDEFVQDMRDQTAMYLQESKDAKTKIDELSKELFVLKNELAMYKFKAGLND